MTSEDTDKFEDVNEDEKIRLALHQHIQSIARIKKLKIKKLNLLVIICGDNTWQK